MHTHTRAGVHALSHTNIHINTHMQRETHIQRERIREAETVTEYTLSLYNVL